MPLYTSKSVLLGLTALFSAVSFTASADEITTFTKGGAAIGGTDPVAYFTEGKPVAGSDEYTFTYDDVTWKFSSEENRDKFAAEPAKYAPQYGGFCAFGAAMGFKVPVVPEAWSIVDGKLYLNNSLKVQERFEQDVPGHINNATLNWEIIKDKKPEELKEPIIRN
ncbi:YHS domain-containing (seleno)protein [Roseibium porphyridii]|uniref:YHS domain-containing (Seleno)protein n=1 Tax=Roseibium porphyridii TaxID=2866279 RepID=A0ABY8FAV3_9HYPH|nr:MULTISPECIES: YHS domain-containing (seleno)protein [Stappiaceae]QFT31111.1 YHS domain protein [Labrenzia sp. THAF82]WFE91719.1 YHS domain-containing (seleno)protein [Roseibium sp. KMA01]